MSTPYNYLVNPQVTVSGLYRSPSWTCSLPATIYDRELLRMAIQGPTAAKLLCYLGSPQSQNLFDTTLRADTNTADYSGGPVQVLRGIIVTLVWTPLGTNVFTGNEAVQATFTVRQVRQT